MRYGKEIHEYEGIGYILWVRKRDVYAKVFARTHDSRLSNLAWESFPYRSDQPESFESAYGEAKKICRDRLHRLSSAAGYICG